MKTPNQEEKQFKRNIGRRSSDLAIRQDNKRYNQLLIIGQLITSEIHFKSLFSVIMKQTNEIMNTERSTIFLYDNKVNELWSLVATGMDEQKITIPANQGIAGWVFQMKKSLCINDAYNDSRFNSAVDIESGYRTKNLLSIPLINRLGECIGVLQVLNCKFGRFKKQDTFYLESISKFITVAIENAKLYDNVKKYSENLKSLNKDLEKGKHIQKDFLPRNIPVVRNCDIKSYFHSALQLSGDFYDVFTLPNNQLAFIVGDVSDKGVGSALFMTLIRSLLRIFSGSFNSKSSFNECIEPNEVIMQKRALKSVSLVNEYIEKEHCEDGMFVTLFFAIIDPMSGKVYYINGGHEPALVVGKNGIKKFLTTTGPALGPIREATYNIKSFQLETGDILFTYTDGVTEALSKTNKFYKRYRLEKVINKGINGSSKIFLESIETDLFNFIGDASQSDDITMLAIKWKS